MTACTNKARGAVVAALAGVLALGAVPAVALATGSDVSLQFADPEGAFDEANIVRADFKHGASAVTANADGVYQTTFVKNQPIVLDEVEIAFYGTGETGQFVIDPDKYKDEFDVEYFERNEDGYPASETPVTDPTAVGNYVAKITAVKGQYEGGVLYVPFDINPIQVASVELASGSDTVIYNGEVRDFDWILKDASDAEIDATEGVDYTVQYVYTGHDATDENVKDVRDAGTYGVKIVGSENGTIEGTDTLVTPEITVEELDLDKATTIIGRDVWIENVIQAGAEEPENLYYIWIEGQRFGSDSTIVSELKADLQDPDQTWNANGGYTYKLSAKDANNPNIENSTTFTATKVANQLTFKYGDAELPESHTVVINDLANTAFDFSKVTGFYKDGTVGGKTVTTGLNYDVIDASTGAKVNDALLRTTPGNYVIAYWNVAGDHSYGGTDFVNVKVVQDKVDADAKAVVLYDVDGDDAKEVVTSISTTYNPGVNLADGTTYIDVAVRDSNGAPVDRRDYDVSYYNADGVKVNKVTNAGTYTLKLTSSKYELSGTTELTITIAPMDLSVVRSGAVQKENWDDAGNVTEYLPWRKASYTISGTQGKSYSLKLQYQDANENWVDLPMDQVKVYITQGGEEIERISDEGVYTIKFEARNVDAANNYVIPGDLTLTCIKDGGAYGDGPADHLKFRDVAYTDYFANAVDHVSDNGYMTGYDHTKLFGSYDSLERGQMAIVLYNMAKVQGKMSENDLQYSELGGYVTGFDDVDGNKYYAKAIAWAKLAGVVNGYGDGTFRPEQSVTREEFAAMIMNYEKKFGDYEQADASVLDEFSDAASITPWATNAMSWAVANGVVNGTAEGTLIPTCDIIRADAACMVYNYTK